MVSKSHRVEYLDGIRAMAVIFVLVLHWMPQYMPASITLFQGGYIGVDLFFILSGFLITRIVWFSPIGPLGAGYMAFLRRRFRRLYPALLGMLAVVTVLIWVLGQPTDGITAIKRAVIAGLQLTPIIELWRPGSMLPFEHTWTLGWEWAFYCLWPLVLLKLRGSKDGLQKVLGASVAAATVFYLLSALVLPSFVMYKGPLGRFAELLLGSALGLFLILRSGPVGLRPALRNFLMWGSVSVLCWWSMAGPSERGPLYSFIGFPVVASAALVLIACAFGHLNDPVPRLLAWRPLTRLGTWSYSLYLWHLPFLRLAQGAQQGVPTPLLAGTCLLGTAIFTWLSYRFLEAPFLAPRRRMNAKDKTKGPEVFIPQVGGGSQDDSSEDSSRNPEHPA